MYMYYAPLIILSCIIFKKMTWLGIVVLLYCNNDHDIFWMRIPRVASYFYVQVALHKTIVRYWWSVWFDWTHSVLLPLTLSVCLSLSLTLHPSLPLLSFSLSFSFSLPLSLSLSSSLPPFVFLSLSVYPSVTLSYIFTFAFTILHWWYIIIPSCTLILCSPEVINYPDSDVNVLADCKGNGTLSQQENHTQGFGSKELHVRNEAT